MPHDADWEALARTMRRAEHQEPPPKPMPGAAPRVITKTSSPPSRTGSPSQVTSWTQETKAAINQARARLRKLRPPDWRQHAGDGIDGLAKGVRLTSAGPDRDAFWRALQAYEARMTAAYQRPQPAPPTEKRRNWLKKVPLSADHAAMVIAGVKTQVALRGVWTLPRPRPLIPVVVRDGPSGVIGSEPLAQVKVLGHTHRALGSYIDHDARAEGMASLDDYKRAWERWCGPWNPAQIVTVVRFRFVPQENVLAHRAVQTQDSDR